MKDLKTFLIWQLRKISYRFPARTQALAKARVDRGLYKCAHCTNIFGPRDVQVDHILPVVDPAKGWVSWDDYITRMFCGPEQMQILCKPCHKIKTDAENKGRKRAPRKPKSKSKKSLRNKKCAKGQTKKG